MDSVQAKGRGAFAITVAAAAAATAVLLPVTLYSSLIADTHIQVLGFFFMNTTVISLFYFVPGQCSDMSDLCHDACLCWLL